MEKTLACTRKQIPGGFFCTKRKQEEWSGDYTWYSTHAIYINTTDLGNVMRDL